MFILLFLCCFSFFITNFQFRRQQTFRCPIYVPAIKAFRFLEWTKSRMIIFRTSEARFLSREFTYFGLEGLSNFSTYEYFMRTSLIFVSPFSLRVLDLLSLRLLYVETSSRPRLIQTIVKFRPLF